ncbi:BQ5605_C025g09979 [Microbotryum silenes-dioicae]|uniref:BQ5605_C025g09979 protein n=1 Tax=Microbotryum silenes-dioicae TaxID=796604 RepID=A0A2X0MM41_9BASI|nr:BQ5605_C025g09979 [Microbotryum silenes-dioicae]
MLATKILSVLAIALPVFAAPVADSASPAAAMGFDRRTLQRETSSRIALARVRAARKAKRSVRASESKNLATRNFEDAYAAVGLTRGDFESQALSKRSQPRIRCRLGREANAQAKADALCVRQLRGKLSYDPKVATVTCDQVCTVSCPKGYTTQTTDRSTACIKNVGKCKNKTCAQSENGVSGCADGKCTLQCTTRGYTINKAQNACIALGSDPNNCGREGNKCDASYDGKYAASCVTGACSLDCPSGFKAGTNKRRQKTCVKA